jgi:hypothetical protein
MAVPDSSPRASVGVPVRVPQMLQPADRTFFLLVANAFPWGRVSGPAGLAPEALQECDCSCRGFFASFHQCAEHLFQLASAMFRRLRSHAHDWYFSRSLHPRRCSRASSPRAWARSRQSGRALRLILNAPSSSLRRTEGEFSTTPIDGVADCGFLVELRLGGSSGRPCPVR